MLADVISQSRVREVESGCGRPWHAWEEAVRSVQACSSKRLSNMTPSERRMGKVYWIEAFCVT